MLNKTLKRIVQGAAATLGIVGLLSLGVTPSSAVTPNPIPSCSDGVCYLSFDYSGDYYYWTPPAGINSLHFDVYGAQGGRTGGRGGLVSGDLQTLTTPLYIYVGGAGGQGNAAAGGFNGGGIAGSGHADAGSGGGATDLRLSTSLADRIVVAGGGGGMGGWIGGAGGPGGLTIATAGTKGSVNGTAGGGGTQTSGGTAGLGVTTGNGTAGSLATGGTGGNGSVAGGGGGGGGFFGGGGGGSDSVSGGNDGAGGGGGSSFATLALTSNVTHQAGAKVGNGQVYLRYTYAPTVTSFFSTGHSVTANSTDYRISFDQYTYGVDVEDFVISGSAASGCFINNLYGDGYVYQFQVVGCANGQLNLSLRAGSIYGATAGPAVTANASAVQVDNVNPGFHITSPNGPTNSEVLKFQVIADEPFTNPGPGAFTTAGTGCQIVNWPMTSASSMEVWVSGCYSGSFASLYLLPRTVRDSNANLGPNTMVGGQPVQIDRDAPTVAEVIAESPMADLVPYRVTFNEPVNGLDSSSFAITGDGCTLSKLDGGGSQYQLWLSGCAETPVLTVKANSARDEAGNQGPVTDVTAGAETIDETSPSVTFRETSRASRGVSPSFEINFTEPVEGFSLNSLVRTGTAKECTFQLTEIVQRINYQLQSTGCGAGTLRIALPQNSVSDTQGNLGPIITTESALVAIDFTPTSKPEENVSVSSIGSHPTTPEGKPLDPASETVSSQNQTKESPSGETFEALATRALEKVPNYGWLLLAGLVAAVRFSKRLIRR
ncbi:MAG: hypothetical protein RL683_817 [Actinomycetota bacterium]